MPQVPTTPDTKPLAGNNRGLLVPPEEQFWKRYSPHHEFPLSSATSFVLHLLGLGLLLLIAFLLFSDTKKPDDVPRMEPVEMERGPNVDGDPRGGAGGGGKGGVGGKDKPTLKKEIAFNQPKKKYRLPRGKTGLVVPVGAPKIMIPSAKDGTRQLPSGEAFDDLKEEARRTFAALANAKKTTGGGDPGEGGGSGGGKDRGRGTDKGKGVGPGKKKAEVEQRRIQRQLRWKVVFQNVDGTNYRDQLYALGAILVIADYAGPAGPGGQAPLKYERVIYDLAKGKIETGQDVTKINGIFWIDDNTATVKVLAGAVGVSPRPPLFACFFSRAVEKELRRLEMNKTRLRESQIYGTHFRVVPAGNGPYTGINGQKYKLVCDRVISKMQARRMGLIR
jgi:hypothetical protein